VGRFLAARPGDSGELGSRQQSTSSCQSPRCVLFLFSRRRGGHQVSDSVEPAPPAALPAMSGGNLQPVERVVTLRPATPAESLLARRARPGMAPQTIEKARFTPENGAPFLPRHDPGDRWRRSRKALDEGNLPVPQTDRDVRRPGMAPQAIEKLGFAPENGAPLHSRSEISARSRFPDDPAWELRCDGNGAASLWNRTKWR